MNVVCYKLVCFERGLLWTWSVTNWSVLNVICYERVCYEQVCYEQVCYEQVCYEQVCYEQVCYEQVCYERGLFRVVYYEWFVMNRSILNGHRRLIPTVEETDQHKLCSRQRALKSSKVCITHLRSWT